VQVGTLSPARVPRSRRPSQKTSARRWNS
jgi:hypothetical protein